MTVKERITAQWRKWPRWRQVMVILFAVGLLGGLGYLSKTIQETRAVTQTESIEPKAESSHLPATTSSSVAATTKSAATKSTIWVEVKGAVKQPDVYQFNREIRVKDLIKRAGGLTAAADDRQLNLAAKLQDGQSIYVPEQGEALAENEQTSSVDPSTGTPPTEAGSEAQVDLNHADLTQLQQISGIGPKKAADIVAYREENGGFKNVDELTAVSGIGEKTLEKIRHQVCVN